MADPESVNGMIDMTGAHAISHENIIVTGQGIEGADITGTEVNSETFLQQALVDAPEGLVQGSVQVQQYAVTGGEDDLESASVEEQLINSVVTSGAFESQVTENQSVVFEGATYPVVSSDTVVLDPNAVDNNRIYISTSTVPASVDDTTQGEQDDSNTSNNASETKGISVTLVATNEGSGAPLGSSQNPIRIIQQGNQYTPMQHLTSEQLHQIMQVVQQQQVAKSTSQEGSSILFNPQTNTRIVYRVIYPSELHKAVGIDGATLGIKRQSQGQQTQTVIIKEGQRRQYKKRLRVEEDERLDGPDLTKEEKEERKKHRPRTRSGRISKPPKHMVKDYKHIHVLDLEEEEAADDSDGGYSDFKYSDDEHAIDEKDDDVSFEGFNSLKPRKYKCKSCQKAYVGRGGLSRHYKIFPQHGSIEDHGDIGVGSPNKISQNGVNITGNISEDSNTQDSTSSTPPTTNFVRRNYHYRGGFRGRLTNHETATARRRNKLKELIKQCQDEELMEIVLPRLTKAITLWEFLLMKVENKKTVRPNMVEIYHEFESLAKQIEKICKTYLQPATESEGEGNSVQNRLKVQEDGIGQALGLKQGVYDVKEMTLQEHSTFQYKFLTTDIENIQKSPNQSLNRTVEVVSHEQLVSPAKKIKTVHSGNSAYKTNKITISPQYKPSGRQKNSITVVHHPIKVAANKKPTVVSSGSAVVPNSTAVLQNSSSSSSSSSGPAPLIIQPVSQTSNNILSVKSGPGSQQLRINNSNVVSSSILVNPQSSDILNSTAQTSPMVVTVQPNTMPNIKVTTLQPNQSIEQVLTSGVSLLPPNLKASLSDNSNTPSASNSTSLSTSFTNSIMSKPGTKVVRIVSSDVGLLNALPNLNASDILNLVSSGSLANSVPCFTSDTPVTTSDAPAVGISAPSNVINHSVNPTVITHDVNGSTPAVIVKSESGLSHEENVLSLQSLQENSQGVQITENESENFVTANFINSTDSDILEVKESESPSMLSTVCENVNPSDTDQTMVEIIDPASVENQQDSEMVQLVDTPILDEDEVQRVQLTDGQVITASNIYQTSEGIIIIQNEDGSTVQLQGGDGEPIPLETVQALLAMDTEGQLLQTNDEEMDQ